ncbi:hypothetical protein [Halocatena marina]|uniref:hypothetical protein n=1 Tax=Halocatena marina TaxID=2934937 RepID=UPI0022253650|nr:hypothetical protein [Halocatena marina]
MHRRTVLPPPAFLLAILTVYTGLGPSNGVLGVTEDATAHLEMTALADATLPPKVPYGVWKGGSEAAWFVDGSDVMTLITYEYTVSQVTPAAEYGRQMRERSAFALSGPSDAQRDIVETAISKEQYVVSPDEGPPSVLVTQPIGSATKSRPTVSTNRVKVS